MRGFFDSLADAHFVPQDDGRVRFVLPKSYGGYLVLEEAEADGVKILWRPIVRFYIYALHVCVPVGLIAPWTGLGLLAVWWAAGHWLVRAIRLRFGREMGRDEGQRQWINSNLSHSISRRAAVWLSCLGGITSACSILSAYLLPSDIMPLGEPLRLLPIFLVGLSWVSLFAGLARSPEANENWARAEKT